MRTFYGILLGFMAMPATFGLIGLFAYLGVRYNLSPGRLRAP